MGHSEPLPLQISQPIIQNQQEHSTTMDPSFLVLSLRRSSNACSSSSSSNSSSTVAGVREYKRRRYHTKSRRGCAACRQKRVKCDQAKPACLRCSRNKRHCVYLDEPGDDPDDASSQSLMQYLPTSSSPNSSARSSHHNHASESHIALARSQTRSLSPTPSPKVLSDSFESRLLDMGYRHTGTSIHELVHHFLGSGGEMMGSSLFNSTACRLWTSGDHAPYLRSALLALTACHLRINSSAPTPHVLAELSQESVALPAFQKALGQPLTPMSSDALILTSLVLGMLSWAVIAPDDPRQSWVYLPANDKSKLGWLTMMMGLRPVLMATYAHKEESLMWRVFTSTAYVSGQAAGAPGGPVAGTGPDLDMDRIPERWRALAEFSFNGEDPREIQCLIPPLTVLTAMRGQRPTVREQLMPYFQVIGRLQPRFRKLLAHNDVRALWIIGYIFAVMGRLRIWWCGDKIRRDYKGIRLYLDEVGLANLKGNKGALWRELLQELDMAASGHA